MEVALDHPQSLFYFVPQNWLGSTAMHSKAKSVWDWIDWILVRKLVHQEHLAEMKM